MDYNLSYLRERVLVDKLDDDTFDPDIVDRFLNDVQRSVFNTYKLPFMEKVFAGELSATSAIFTFPEDYREVQSLVITSPDGQRRNLSDFYMPFRDFVTRYPSATTNPVTAPTIWTLHGDKLYFSAPTDQNYTMTMYYLKRPKTLAEDSDVPEIPEDFQDVLICGAYYRILQRNEDFDIAAAVKSEYLDELDKMVMVYGPRQSARPHIIGTPLSQRRR